MKLSSRSRTALIVSIPLTLIVGMIFGGGPPVWHLRAMHSTPRSVVPTPLQLDGGHYWLLSRQLRYGGGKGSSGKTWTNFQVINGDTGAVTSHFYFNPGTVFGFSDHSYVGLLDGKLIFDSHDESLDERIVVVDPLSGQEVGSSASVLTGFSSANAATPSGVRFRTKEARFELSTKDGVTHLVDLSGEPVPAAPPEAPEGFAFQLNAFELVRSSRLTPQESMSSQAYVRLPNIFHRVKA